MENNNQPDINLNQSVNSENEGLVFEPAEINQPHTSEGNQKELEDMKGIIEVVSDYVEQPTNNELSPEDVMIFTNSLKLVKSYIPLKTFGNQTFKRLIDFLEEQSKNTCYPSFLSFTIDPKECEDIKEEMAIISNLFTSEEDQKKLTKVPKHILDTIDIAYNRAIELMNEFTIQQTLNGNIGEITSDAYVLLRGTIANINMFMKTIEETK